MLNNQYRYLENQVAMVRCSYCQEEFLEKAFTKSKTMCNQCYEQTPAGKAARRGMTLEQVQEAEDKVAADAKKAAADRAALQRRLSGIFLSTGTIQQPYSVVDIVFAIDSHAQGLLDNILSNWLETQVGGAKPSQAFDNVKLQLRYQCHEMGGDAVLNCQFEHRVAVTNALPIGGALNNLLPGGGVKPVVEIFAYGTVVKLIRP